MTETPRYLSMPFINAPVLQSGEHVGFVVGVTLTHNGQSVTEQVEAICGKEKAAALMAGHIEAYTEWSRGILEEHDLVARANAAMDAILAETAPE